MDGRRLSPLPSDNPQPDYFEEPGKQSPQYAHDGEIPIHGESQPALHSDLVPVTSDESGSNAQGQKRRTNAEASRRYRDKLSDLRRKIYTLKQWITEQNEDPQGPISKEKRPDKMSTLELKKESSFLQSRVRAIFIRKLQVESKWEPWMDSLTLRELRNKASETISRGFANGDASFSEEVMNNRENR
ncbi:hypothetical protein UA08_09480 [Talaromyces atroroseus]|uniref:Uncharacterized protein n=1 Tax=Talaromyces atroroseus TaxID=1441469 RepID=A0A1Q5Q6B9_TALAT|nr:hypothetical protein UA08_09480 [Talaromyces atroroseus]OKL55253.1 hypothetical protein UA08_09480 [Talaromyces atroroseus]